VVGEAIEGGRARRDHRVPEGEAAVTASARRARRTPAIRRLIRALEVAGFRPERVTPALLRESPGAETWLATCPCCRLLDEPTLSIWALGGVPWPCCWKPECAGHEDVLVLWSALRRAVGEEG
jgi:hypothetical protein